MCSAPTLHRGTHLLILFSTSHCRFGQIQDCRVLYSKNESDFLEYDHFDWLITGDPRYLIVLVPHV